MSCVPRAVSGLFESGALLVRRTISLYVSLIARSTASMDTAGLLKGALNNDKKQHNVQLAANTHMKVHNAGPHLYMPSSATDSSTQLTASMSIAHGEAANSRIAAATVTISYNIFNFNVMFCYLISALALHRFFQDAFSPVSSMFPRNLS